MKRFIIFGSLLMASLILNAQNYFGVIGAIPGGADYKRNGEPHTSIAGHAMVGLGYYDESQKACVLEVFGNYPKDYVKTWKKLPYNDVPGEIKKDLETLYSNEAVFSVFKITQAQFNAVKEKKASWNRRGAWALVDKDCVSFMQEAACEMGLSVPSRYEGLRPISYMKSIATANKMTLNLGAKGSIFMSLPNQKPCPTPQPNRSNGGGRERVSDREHGNVGGGGMGGRRDGGASGNSDRGESKASGRNDGGNRSNGSSGDRGGVNRGGFDCIRGDGTLHCTSRDQ